MALTYVLDVSPTAKCHCYCELCEALSHDDIMTSQTGIQEEELMFLIRSNLLLLIPLQLADIKGQRLYLEKSPANDQPFQLGTLF